MAFLKLNFRPGVNRDQTSYSGEGGWYECDKIRFLSGFPQKLGGWAKYTPTAFLGTCRQLWNWITSFGDNLLALGTNLKVYIEVGGLFYDITPLRATTAAGDVTFAATDGSSTITVSDTNFGSSAGDFVTFSGAVSLGGNITAAVLNQNYQIATVINSGSYTIVAKDPSTGAAVVANSSDSGNGGASVVGAYEIPVGYAATTYGYGWGSGPWNGNYGWGQGSSTPINLPQRDWFFDNFDNDLVMNIKNGAIYYWSRGSLSTPSTALGTRAVLLSSLAGANSVPEEAIQVLVSQNDKHLLAFGCTPYYVAPTPQPNADPLLIRWASQDEPQVWNPAATNSAGFLRVSRGSQIVRALATRQEILVWTNATLSSLQYLGTTDVFAIQELADNITIMAPRAVTTANNVVYWMGQDKFYVYNGQVQTLPTTLRQHVFENFNYDQADQVVSGTNEGYTEIWWFYPSATSNWNDSYVVYNHLENVWYYGSMVRTAWLDTALRARPAATSTAEGSESGYLYSHEFGTNDDGAPMTSYIQSADFDISDGEQFMLTRRMIPDINFNGSTAAEPEVTLEVRPRRFPGSAYMTGSSYEQPVIETSVGVYTDQVFIRARARQLAVKVESDTLDVQWQLGSMRLDVRQDGKR